jgi:hypothetical protein
MICLLNFQCIYKFMTGAIIILLLLLMVVLVIFGRTMFGLGFCGLVEEFCVI